jgi:WD40 repeat protein
MRKYLLFKLLVISLFALNSNNLLKAQSEQFALLETLQIGKGNANSVAWNPNIDVLAIGGSDGIRLYDDNLQEIAHFTDQLRSVDNLTWSPDGTKIANHGPGLEVQIRDASTGNILTTLTQPNGVYAIAWSPDGQYLAISSGLSIEHRIIIWDWNLGETVRTLENQDRLVSLDWSPDGTRVAAGSWDTNIYIWEVNTGALLAQLDNQNSIASTVVWSPDGAKLATTGSSENALVVWDTTTYEPIYNSELSRNIDFVAWRPDGSQLAINSTDDRIFILNGTTGEHITTIESETGVITSLSWNHNGNKLAVLSFDYFVKIWDFTSDLFSRTLDSYAASGLAVAVAWRPNTEQVAVVFDKLSLIKVFDSFSGSLINELTIPLSPSFVGSNSTIMWNFNGTRLLYTGNEGNAIYIWNLVDGQSAEPLVIMENQSLYSPNWSPDGNRIASVRAGQPPNEILVWEVVSGELLDQLTIQESGLFLWNYDGAFVVFQNEQGYWQIGDTGRQIVITTSLSSTSTVMAVGEPNGDRILVADCDEQPEGCQLWEGELASGEFTQLIYDESINVVTALEWSPDGNLLAVSGEFTIHIWDMRTLSLIAETNFSNSDIPISWSFDSRRIAIVTGGTVKILSLEGIN